MLHMLYSKYIIHTLQSIGTEEGATMITKSLIFYVAITLEAFVFCYAGEYLSAKVSVRERNDSIVESLKFRINSRRRLN